MRTGHEIYTTKVQLVRSGNVWGCQLGDDDWTKFTINGVVPCQSDLKRAYLYYFQPNIADVCNALYNPNNYSYINMLFRLYEKYRIAAMAYDFRPTFTKEMIAIDPRINEDSSYNFSGADVSSRKLIYGFTADRRRLPTSGVNDSNLLTGWDNIMAHQTGIKKHSMDKPLRVYFKPTGEVPTISNAFSDDGNGAGVQLAGNQGTVIMAVTSSQAAKTIRSPWEYTSQGSRPTGAFEVGLTNRSSALHGMYLGFPALEFKTFDWQYNVTYYLEFKDRRAAIGTLSFGSG